MVTCGKRFSPELIGRIRQTVKDDPSISRRMLSRQVCKWLDWKAPNGRFQDMSCRKALNRLAAAGFIELPENTKKYTFQTTSAPLIDFEAPAVASTLKNLGKVEVVPVVKRESYDAKIWNTLLEKYHYLGRGPLAGEQIRYLIKSEHHGYIGALAFSAATWRLAPRDTWIGWSEKARRTNLRRVIQNSRFLILPTVNVPNLATRILGLTVKRLGKDWEARYGHTPVLIETFVDPARFKGTSYQAANWQYLGKTAARKTPFPNGKVADGPKDIYVYPCVAEWKSSLSHLPVLRDTCPSMGNAMLRTEPPKQLDTSRVPETPSDWVEEELGGVEIFDDRLKSRLHTITRDFFARPGVLVPESTGGCTAKTRAAYRFFNNKQVNMDIILQPHVEATIGRINEHKVVLAVQDTTSLNYKVNHEIEGLGPINTKERSGMGLILHDTMAFSVAGTPLGVLDAQCWARNPNDMGKRSRRKELPIEQKESNKWLKSYNAVSEIQKHCPDTMLVSVGDREADLYELFAETVKNPQGPKLLVRAEYTRNRRVEEIHLWERMKEEPVAGHQEVYVRKSGTRPARTAKIAVRHLKIELTPPVAKDLPPVTAWAVHAAEEAEENVSDPISWMLLTTVETSDFAEASERIDWYARRWGIEVYHRTLKSGCRIEDRRLDHANRLETCLAIDLVVGWRIFLLTLQGRETPDLPCNVYLDDDEWKALYIFVKQEEPPKEPPVMRDAIRMIASLGGFLGRKADGEPGTTTVWRGLERLADISLTYKRFNALHKNKGSP